MMRRAGRWRPTLVLTLLLALAGCMGGGPPPVVERPVIDPGSAVNGLYTVRRGDTLYSIAWAFDWEYQALARANGIQPPYVIQPGQKLRVARPTSRARPEVVGKPARVHTASIRPPAPTRPAPRAPADLRWQWPIDGRLVAGFGNTAGGADNKGIDIEAAPGAPIRAAAAGEVVYAGKGIRGVGRLVIIKHDSDYLSAYGLGGRITVPEGRQVKAGDKIAETGETGAAELRLHFEIRRDGQPLDPTGLLPAR